MVDHQTVQLADLPDLPESTAESSAATGNRCHEREDGPHVRVGEGDEVDQKGTLVNQKNPWNPWIPGAFPLCAEGDLNPHPLSRTSTSS